MNILLKYQKWSWILLLVPIYLFIFLKLGVTHIRLWDEGWFSVHAIEMWKKGSWFVSYFDGAPNLSSSKPPLQTWLQIMSLSLFGISELALRLPSALAASATVLLCFFFWRKHISTGFALSASMVLLTSIGFIGFHTARGAEADALLTFVLVGQAICFFEFVQTRHWLWFWGLVSVISISFWVKSMAAFLMLPAFVLYSLVYHKSLVALLLKSWSFYLGIAIAFAIAVSYVLIRENAQPGYVGMFFKSNVGRYASSVGHNHRFDYYLRNMLEGRYMWWFVLSAFGILFSIFHSNASKSVVTFSAFCAIGYFLVISFSKSKLVWYDMPFYPMAAVPAALTIGKLTNLQTGWKKMTLMVVVFFFPTYQMFLHAQANTLNLQEMNFESQEIFLNQAFKQGKDLNDLIVVHDHFNGALIFYRHKFETISQKIILKNNIDGLQVNDRVLVRGDEHKAELHSRFHAEKLDDYKKAEMFKILGTKQTEITETEHS